MDLSYLILVKGLFLYKRKGAISLYTSAAVLMQNLTLSSTIIISLRHQKINTALYFMHCSKAPYYEIQSR